MWFFSNLVSAGTSPFREEDTVQQLEKSWVDVNAINQEVDAEIQTAATKNFTIDQYYEKLNSLKELNPDMTDDEVWETWLKLSKQKNYSIEGYRYWCWIYELYLKSLLLNQ